MEPTYETLTKEQPETEVSTLEYLLARLNDQCEVIKLTLIRKDAHVWLFYGQEKVYDGHIAVCGIWLEGFVHGLGGRLHEELAQKEDYKFREELKKEKAHG